MAEVREVNRGSVYYVNLPKEKVFYQSCEQGERPCVVVSSNIGCKTSDIVMVCPITSKIKEHSCNVNVTWTANGKQCQVLCNQIITVPKSSLVRYKGYINNMEMREVNKAIIISLGITGGFIIC